MADVVDIDMETPVEEETVETVGDAGREGAEEVEVVEVTKAKAKVRVPVRGYGQYPISRTTRVMKCDPNVQMVSKTATILMTRSAEWFTVYLGKVCAEAAKSHKRKTLKFADIADVAHSHPSLAFLGLTIPQHAYAERDTSK
ncbi:hypothetical protein KIPB_009246 [Kipferlia bialata]|uniref:Transcription factor CBF/NF-Y/archaeal histone domain-containing protein n=1 Tax=Kipferlia bialata TaxID=797122 RepID=A0A9K3D3D2_9EUKA|nr:hypothetical protein KIPB_009246 [Kipferlia bialata]|eukprot:g9246.t1